MADELDRIEPWINDVIQRVSPAARSQFTRRLATGLRQRQAARIASQQNPDGSPFEARKPRKAGRIRRRAEMFQQLRQARHLQAASDADSVAVGFGKRDSIIARVHQLGLQARVDKQGPLHRYAVRKLLGWADADRAWVMEQLAAFIGE